MKLNLKIADFIDKISPRLALWYINKCRTTTFEQYLIEIGIRYYDWEYSRAILSENIKYFKKCWKDGLSPYKAILFLNDEINKKQL